MNDSLPPLIDAMFCLALELAQRGLGLVEPNPMVGCVLLGRDGTQILGEGYHTAFGEPHAEVEALRDARDRGHDPRGATCVVTLEPCCHTGMTPPCTDALIEGGVATVWVAMLDPDPRVSGGGVATLRGAGAEVHVLDPAHRLARLASSLNEGFIHRLATGLPWTIGKWAQTLDGQIATMSGDSKWISSAASRERVHRLRGVCDAVMVGAGTAVADDPLLTARPGDPVGVKRLARRVVVDPGLRWASRVLRDENPPRMLAINASRGGVWPPVTVGIGMKTRQVAALPSEHDEAGEAGEAGVRALRERGVEMLQLPDLADSTAKPRLDLRPLLAHLVSAHAATRVLVEGGSGLIGSLLRQGLLNELQVYLAPRLLGDGVGPADLPPAAQIRDGVAMELVEVEAVPGGEGDVWLRYRLTR